MTKKQALARKQAWSKALSEGRVIRYAQADVVLNCTQYSFVAYPTKEQADRTLGVQLARIAAGESIHIGAHIVVVAS